MSLRLYLESITIDIDMDWAMLKSKIYYIDGSLLDIYVEDTIIGDWRKWADYVNENYRVEWFNSKENKVENKINLDIVCEYWEGVFDTCSWARIFIGKIQINSFFFDDLEIENDIDPKELTSIDDHNNLMQYLIGMSNALNKEVILTPENTKEKVLLRVKNETISF